MTETSAEKKELLKKAQLSIWLDTYDDIFSDFDPRPFSERLLSDDFVNETRKIAKEKTHENLKLKLLIPEEERDAESERIVTDRLHKQFRIMEDQRRKEIKKSAIRDYLLAASGFALMIICAYLVPVTGNNVFINIVRIVLEPSGWFLVWTGFDGIYQISRKRTELRFYEKIANAEIIFLSL